MKKAAIYTRKSKFTEKGESIQNQIQICKDYLNRDVEDYEFIIYEDEGFSGKNTERPEFKKMIKDAKDKKFNILICYRLDRISRNIADFATLIKKLEKYEIGFISVNEQFDTNTPMGRAMMYITSVFAQLERETIAERVKDNMIELAKSGRWLGGRTPTGYESIATSYTDSNLKDRKIFGLKPIHEELELVKLIFNKYLELKSLSGVTKFLLSHNTKTKLNTNWDYAKVKNILVNPVYVMATKETIEYIKSTGINVLGAPNNLNGILTYNKKKNKTGPYRNCNEWIYAIGTHDGIIPSEDWIKVQQLINNNKDKCPRLGSTNTALLSSILKCGHCGSPMRVAYGSKNSSGKRNYYYSCSLKHKSGSTLCNNANIRGDIVDTLVIQKLIFLYINKPFLIKKLKEKIPIDNNEEKALNTTILKNDSYINNLLTTLSMTENTDVKNHILKRITELNEENKILKNNLKKYEKPKSTNICNSNFSINNFTDIFNLCNFDEKKFLLKSIIKKIEWHGDSCTLNIKLRGCDK